MPSNSLRSITDNPLILSQKACAFRSKSAKSSQRPDSRNISKDLPTFLCRYTVEIPRPNDGFDGIQAMKVLGKCGVPLLLDIYRLRKVAST